MIYDTLAHVNQYKGLYPGLDKALDFLCTANLNALPDGRTEIDGDTVYASLMSYTTRIAAGDPENHKEHLDVFYLLEGEELVGVAPLEDMGELTGADPAKDVEFHKGETVLLPLNGHFMVLFPGDAHAPSIGPNGPAPARKCVVKVKI